MSTIPATHTAADPTAASRSGRRLAFLDVLRAVAALAVCVQHLGENSFSFFRETVNPWINFGMFGVTAFFLVSGFIIPASLEKYGTLGHFWRGRIFRLYPMYLVALAAVLLAAWLGRSGNPFGSCRHLAVCFAANLTMFQEFFGIQSIVGVAWTLGLEMLFYILCSIVFWRGWLAHSFRLASVAITVVALSAAAGWAFHHSLPAGRIGLLATCFFGTLVFRVYRGQAPSRALWLALPLLLALAASFWVRFGLFPSAKSADLPFAPFTFACVCFSWLAAYAVFFLLYRLRDHAFPAWLAWIGKVSYSLYLIAGVLPWILPRKPAWLWIGESFFGCLVLSAITYRWIERPAMLLAAPARAPSRA